jgi:superfamily II DNA or RNA helicase
MKLRSYQEDALVKMRASIAKGNKRIVMYLATGGGKSRIAAEVINLAAEKGKRAAFLVNRKGLVHQFSKTLHKLGIRHDVAQGENTWITGQPVLVGTIQTVARRGLIDTDIIIIDEGHAAPGSKEYRDLIFQFKDKVVIAITATPFSKGMAKPHSELDGQPLFQDLVVVATIKSLIKQNYLVDCDIFSPSEPDLSGVKLQKNTFGEMDYSEKELGKAVDKVDLIGDIVHHWLRLAGGKQTVVFATNISHSKHIVEQFQAAGVRAEHVDGYMDDRERDPIIKRFETGETVVLSNVAVLREGFDVPAASVMILARPTRSLIAWVQMVGRVLRPAEGKKKALVLDHSGSVLKLGYPTEDLPLKLDDGAVSAAKKAQKEKEEPKEIKCPKCNYIKKTFVCGHCGHAPEQKHGVVHADGELKAAPRKKMLTADKARLFAELKYIAQSRGWSDGRLAHCFRDIAGTWPNAYKQAEPVHPRHETISMVQALAIRYAKGMQKAGENHAR